jgi:hypothetical protein
MNGSVTLHFFVGFRPGVEEQNNPDGVIVIRLIIRMAFSTSNNSADRHPPCIIIIVYSLVVDHHADVPPRAVLFLSAKMIHGPEIVALTLLAWF